MTKRLADKVAVVTGSGRGIGRAIAMAMAREGAKVVINDLGCHTNGSGSSIAVADQVVEEIRLKGGTAVGNPQSVATPEGAKQIMQTAIDHFGKINILVNNAGIVKDRILWEMTDEEWDVVIKTNLYGHFYCTRAAVICMREAMNEGKQKNGRIINVTSHAGIKGGHLNPNYCAAKMGVVGFTYSCALDLWRHRIACNAIAPHAMTRFVDTLSDDRLRKMAEKRGIIGADILPIQEVKNKFFGAPEAIAPLVCWLASDDAENINGHVFLARLGQVGVFSPMDEKKLAFKDGIFDIDELWRIMPVLTAGLPNPAAMH